MDSTKEYSIIKVTGDTVAASTQALAVEEPLEIRVNGSPWATLMRTPGLEKQLVTGFCFTEGLIRGLSDILALEHCSTPADNGAYNVVDIRLAGESSPARTARNLEVRSACGICSRVMLDKLADEIAPVTSPVTIAPQILAGLGDKMRQAQEIFRACGSTHAAAMFTTAGDLIFCAEDLGRHNALDKLIGYALLGRIDMRDKAVALSGRASYELILKAGRAGIPIVAAVSAPTLMAVDLSRKIGLTLAGFMRGDRFNIYSGQERIHL